jgi:Na+-transporting NADH:ubiquinone oxidoreductase subunit F
MQPGEFTITVNNDRKVAVRAGESLLSALTDHGIFVPSSCGGRAACGLCKVKVTAGTGPALPSETPLLSARDLQNQMRLACQVIVQGDVAIELPAQRFAVREYVARVAQIVPLTREIRQFDLVLLGGARMDFTPGQHVHFRIPSYDEVKGGIYRSYSMASTPLELPLVRFIIRRAPAGISTTYLFDHLKEGDEVRLNGPYGRFHLTDGMSKVVFVAGGAGMSAIFALLLQMHEQQSRRPVDFFFGANTVAELFYLDRVSEMAKGLPGLRFFPSVAQKAESERWDGEIGLVTEVLDRHLRPGEADEAFLCGSAGMVDACIKVLASKGIGRDKTFYDKFA